VSRPFVYQTPGQAEGGAGIRRRQPGQVRRRRYLVTEVVTETEAGQRHEVRVHSESVSDAEVDAVAMAPDRQDEPIGQDPNGPEPNDRFGDESDRRTEPAIREPETTVDHCETSYEVRVFLNNPTANASTPQSDR
jgi:hypothetical protein